MEVVKKWISLVTYIASYGYFNTQMIFFVTTNFFVTPLLKRSVWLGSFCETVPLCQVWHGLRENAYG